MKPIAALVIAENTVTTTMIGTFSGQNIHEAISSLRDLGFIIGLVILGWKGRSWVQPIIEFFREANKFIHRANKHMVLVEGGMKLLLENHISHIEAHTKTIADALAKAAALGNEDASSQQEPASRNGDCGTSS